ncbi:hypothetical protein [Alkanindiges hydrocarboniclasticus]|uniref:hypothetical protein n=1 Tax=Alkanindiges hydrocarboniclasticus TaxID=1907941 RepID=UPI00117887B5|nr:hypothetical protein [Alkanindiges hydrocarboniclasticus]
MPLHLAKNKVVCVVRTPLQLFNAIEACQRFHEDDLKYLILVAGSSVDLKMMQAMLQPDQEWTAIKTVIFQGWQKHFYGWQLNRWLMTLKPVKAVYIGMIRHVPLHVVNVIQPEQVWILDDGNESLMIARQIHAWQQQKTILPDRWQDQFLDLQLNPQRLLKAHFFSAFEIQAPNNCIVNNDYRCFKAKVRQLPIRPDILVIGSNLVGTYLKDESTLLLRLQQLHRDLPANVPQWYAPHRYESSSLIRRIQKLGYQIYQPRGILEYSQLQQGWRFSASYSIRSTAIETLYKIYEIPGFLCQVPASDFINLAKWQECVYIWQQYPETISLNQDKK